MSDPTVGVTEVGAGPISGGGLRSVPVGTITAPAGTLESSTFTATWTYSSPSSRPQLWSRGRVLTTTGSELYSSGNVSGAGLSLAVPYALSSGTYQFELTVSDGVDSHTSSSSFNVSLQDVTDFPDEPRVGTVFEIGINGVGYMLSDTRDRPYRRQVGSLQAPRFATGDTPFTEAIDRYTFIGQVDWSGGEGQTFADRTRSDTSRYWRSVGVDVFDLDGGIKLLPTTQSFAGHTPEGAIVVLGDTLYSYDSSGSVWTQSGSSDWAAATDPTGTVIDMTTDGEAVFALTSSGLYRTVSSGTSLTWTTLRGTSYGSTDLSLDWCVDRLVATYIDGSSNGVVSTIASDGTEEVGGGRFLFPNRTPVSPTGGDGYLWFGVGSDVYAWNLGSSESRFAALSLPSGHNVTGLQFYLGNVMVYTVEPVSSGYMVHLYRSISAGGQLTPELLVEFESPTGQTRKNLMVGTDRLVLFAWPQMLLNKAPGVGAVDLSTGGVARWYLPDDDSTLADELSGSDFPASGGDRSVFGLYVREGVAGFVHDSDSTYEATAGSYRGEGYLDSSASDLGSGLVKVADEWSVTHAPLASGTSVSLAVSTNEGTTWFDIGSNSSAGSSATSFPIGFEGASFRTRLTLESSVGTVTAQVRSSSLKVHPLTITDDVLELPINCGNEVVGLNGVLIEPQESATARMRRLEALGGSRVRLQDIDWPVTGATETWEVVSVDTTSVGVFDRSMDRRTESGAVCTLTLRRGS